MGADDATLRDVEFPRKLGFLFEPKRFKVAYGGRGGGKSWGFARALLIMGRQRPLRVLCAREFQKSTEDSVHALLKDQIAAMGLDDFYEVKKTEIVGANGTKFGFEGLRHNISSIKSYEGADICWVEEARTVSKTSWDTLIPTIRKDGSEIWISFNPELKEDETYKRFVANPSPRARVERMNYVDNPWCPADLIDEAEELRVKDPDAYLTVWGGHCKVALDGAIYANQIRAATTAGRMDGAVPHAKGVPVYTFWDLGRADMTSIWFAQIVGGEFRLIDYYEARGHFISHYIDLLRTKEETLGYAIEECWLPHDANHELLASNRTIAQQLWAAKRKVRITPNIKVAFGIDMARTIFDRCWFDAERCADGLQCLRNYRYDVDPETKQFSDQPLHDWASHGADAFRYFAVAIAEPKPEKPADERPKDRYGRKRRTEAKRESGWAA